ncbi:MAG: hypothetical protein AB4290_16750, partial [Spirulina sp.]
GMIPFQRNPYLIQFSLSLTAKAIRRIADLVGKSTEFAELRENSSRQYSVNQRSFYGFMLREPAREENLLTKKVTFLVL